jgi:hypothetical protein
VVRITSKKFAVDVALEVTVEVEAKDENTAREAAYKTIEASFAKELSPVLVVQDLALDVVGSEPIDGYLQ